MAVDRSGSCVDPELGRVCQAANRLTQYGRCPGTAVEDLFFIPLRVTAVHAFTCQVDEQVCIFQLTFPAIQCCPVPVYIAGTPLVNFWMAGKDQDIVPVSEVVYQALAYKAGAPGNHYFFVFHDLYYFNTFNTY